MDVHNYARGEIYYTDFGDGAGAEQKGCRPAVIVSNDIGNRHSSTVIIAAITTRRASKAHLPTHVNVGVETGLDSDSTILLEQLRTVSKERLSSYIGVLSPAQRKEMWRALAISVGDSDPNQQVIVMCLCKRCAENFRDTGAYYLRRRYPKQKLELCMYCNYRMGIDYDLIPKGR